MARVVESREIQKHLSYESWLDSHPTYIYGVAGEVGLAYGLGLRATRVPRDMCRGLPGHKSLRPLSMWSHPWANVAGYPDC
jgi:hypothetical protein